MNHAKKKSMSAGRIVAVVGSVGVLALTGISGAGLAAANHAYHPSAGPALPSYSGRPTPSPTSTVAQTYTPLNILVMGSDTRSGKGNSAYGGTSLSSGYGHSDTVLFVHIPADRKWAEVVSIPRDTTVPMPACAQVAKFGLPTVERFNFAFYGGGPTCTAQLVEKFTGMRVDHYVSVNFAGFKQVVNDLGGVPICTKVNIHDVNAKLYLSAGNHILNGDQALGLMRARETLGDGSDLSRINRQQIVLGSIIRKTVSAGTLSDPTKALRVLGAISSSIQVDPGLVKLEDAVNLGLTLTGVSPKYVQFVRMPILLNSDHATVREAPLAQTLWSNLAADKPWPALHIVSPTPSGTPHPTHKPTGPKLTTPPQNVHVLVYNANGVNGSATAYGNKLHAVDGFQILGAGDWKAGKVTTTYVRYDPNWNESALTLATAMGGVKMVPVKGLGSTLQVVLGTTQPAVVKVSVAAPTQSATATPDPSTGITTAGAVRCITG